jgi:hypothetical protein
MKTLYTLKAVSCYILLFIFLVSFSGTVSAQRSMRANLYVVSSTGEMTIADGNYTEYADIYSNNVDVNDIIKMVNPEINFGILRADTTLVIEKRNINNSTDTTFFRMWNMPRKNYRLRLIISGVFQPDMLAFIKDDHLNTLSPVSLNGTTDIDFTVDTSLGSVMETRFKLFFHEKPAVVVNPDTLVLDGINIYPNPISNKTMQIHFGKQPAGKYNLNLVSANGKQQQLVSLDVIASQKNYPVQLPQSLSSGIYRLRVTGPQNLTLVKTILVVNK